MVTPHTVDMQEEANQGAEYFQESSREAYEKWLKSATDKEREIADRSLGFEFNFFTACFCRSLRLNDTWMTFQSSSRKSLSG